MNYDGGTWQSLLCVISKGRALLVPAFEVGLEALLVFWNGRVSVCYLEIFIRAPVDYYLT